MFADGRHTAVTVAGSSYQRIIAAYSDPVGGRGKTMVAAVIGSVGAAVLAGLAGLVRLG